MGAWQRLTQRIFRYFFITADLLTRITYRLSGGRLGRRQAGYSILLLTTRGRKSGKSRTHALLYAKAGMDWIVAGSNGGDARHPHWYLNLLSEPYANIQVGRQKKVVIARVAAGQERQNLWQNMVDIWPAYASYQASIVREIPIIILQSLSGSEVDLGKDPAENNLQIQPNLATSQITRTEP